MFHCTHLPVLSIYPISPTSHPASSCIHSLELGLKVGDSNGELVVHEDLRCRDEVRLYPGSEELVRGVGCNFLVSSLHFAGEGNGPVCALRAAERERSVGSQGGRRDDVPALEVYLSMMENLVGSYAPPLAPSYPT
jgi:hypothetical protein